MNVHKGSSATVPDSDIKRYQSLKFVHSRDLSFWGVTKDTVRGYYNGAISEKTIDCLSKWYADMFKLNIISIQHKLEIKLKKQALKDYSFKAFLLCPLVVYSIPQYRKNVE